MWPLFCKENGHTKVYENYKSLVPVHEEFIFVLSFLSVYSSFFVSTCTSFFKTLFVPRVPYIVPVFFLNFIYNTVFDRMPGFEPELLRPQPGVLPMSTHIPRFVKQKVK